jgi:hypothetical protein
VLALTTLIRGRIDDEGRLRALGTPPRIHLAELLGAAY